MNIKSLFKETSSWDDFQQRLLALTKKQKGDAFELLTKLYFQLNPIYKDLYDEVWMLSEIPQKELEYLDLPSHDLGIDLIVKSGREYHAIQCKYHSDKTSSVTFREVSTFISLLESNDKFSQGYICSSASVTSRNYDKLKTKPINLIMSDSWQHLDEEFFNKAGKLLQGKRTKLIPFKPREHQQKALQEAKHYFKEENQSRGKLIFPCGSGKSLTGFWITQELSSQSTIIAVPSLSLVKQTLEVYLREIDAKEDHVKWLCICSDEGIGRNDDIVYYTKNLGVPCQTDPNYIEAWLKENIEERIIIFTTYQSGQIIADISKKLNFVFDVGIFDEAHKTVGSDKKLFSHLLFDKNISIGKRIFMTATERFYAGQKDDIISMDDDEVYGETFAYMSFKEAVESDLLTDYKLITIEVQKSEIAQFIQENNLVQLNDKWKKETEARSLASMLALRKAMKKFPIKNAVSFHSSIDKAKRNKELQHYITETYDYEPIDAFTVSGKIPTTKRNDIVQEFAKSPKALITNSRCLTEGVDVPNIDCIVFADPRKSKVDIVQALGRALRRKKGKKWGYVVLPVIYDEATEEIDNDSFNEILAIVRGLASNDERIVEYFKEKNESNRIGEERNEQFNFSVLSDYLDEQVFTKELEIRLWDKLAKLNWMPFEEAREYIHKLNLQSSGSFKSLAKKGGILPNIPHRPDYIYKNSGWINWGDWLGTFYIADQHKIYREFREARLFVRSLKINNRPEWSEYCKSGNKPDDIPSSPERTYKNKGWNGLGDWLGTGRIAPQKMSYRPYKEASKFVQRLKLKSGKEWRSYCKLEKKPEDVPADPRNVYKHKGWTTMGDWLGTDKVADQNRIFSDFKDARKFVRSLNLNTLKDWQEYKRKGNRPKNIPGNPNRTYRNKGWKSWGDWLGTNRIATKDLKYRNFEQARKFVHQLKIKNQKEWIAYCKSGELPIDIPSKPQRTYKASGWINLGDWLGNNRIATQKRKYRSFKEIKEFAQKQKLSSGKEWITYCKNNIIPYDIPKYPNKVFKEKGWKGWPDFLGKE